LASWLNVKSWCLCKLDILCISWYYMAGNMSRLVPSSKLYSTMPFMESVSFCFVVFLCVFFCFVCCVFLFFIFKSSSPWLYLLKRIFFLLLFWKLMTVSTPLLLDFNPKDRTASCTGWPKKIRSHLYPYSYKIQIKQKLTDADKEKRVTMCEWFCMCLKMTKTFFCSKIGLQGEYLLLICPRHFVGGNYSCKRSFIGSPFTSYKRKYIR
jgi:hypothetical protein